MWIDTRECVPIADGKYIVQTVMGNVTPMMYTLKGGWNSFYKSDGTLVGEGETDPYYIVRWYKVITPPEVPQKWKDEWLFNFKEV